MKQEHSEKGTLTVRVDMPGLQYDINAYLKAFFPEKDIRVEEPGTEEKGGAISDSELYMDAYISGYKDCENDPAGKSGRIVIEGIGYDFRIDPELGAKNSFKIALYDLLCKLTGKKLPWGNLTGVRPVKIAMKCINEGMDAGSTRRYMEEHYRVSPEKAGLAVDIARRESGLLSGIDHRGGYSLYIDIPFCPTTCLYCSFTSYPYSVWKSRIGDYLDALYREIDQFSRRLLTPGTSDNLCISGAPDTIYIGGGTPTSLDEDRLEEFLGYLTDRIDPGRVREFTCEAGRPDSITRDKLDIMNKYGVTRISVNPQTMQQKTLDIIGRAGTPGQVCEAFGKAREAGFDNINMDIILGLPGEGPDEVADTLSRIEKLGPDSLTVHSLAIKRASRLREHLDEIGLDALQNTEETMDLAAASAAKMGMQPYYLYRQKNMSGNFENTGFSRPGKEGLYNILIMEEVQSIVALGAGAVSKRVDTQGDLLQEENCGSRNDIVNITRCENSKDIDNYISRIDEMIDRKLKLFADNREVV